MADRLSRSEVAHAVLGIVNGSERPASAATVFRLRKTVNLKARRPAVDFALDELAGSGRLHAHPPAKPGGPRLFHRLSPLEYTTQRLASALGGGEPVSVRTLRRVAGKPYAGLVDEALANLAAEGRVRPTRFLSARQLAQLTAITESINSLRPTPLDFTSILAYLDGADPPEQSLDAELDEPRLVGWYTEDLIRLGGLRAVPIPWTWQHYAAWCASRARRPDAERFTRRLLDMAARSVIGLTPHEHEGRLEPDDLEVLPRTPAGYRAYYWTILR